MFCQDARASFALMRALRLSLLLLSLFAVPAFADDDDQDRARRALAAGEIRPLEDVLAVQRRALPGEVVGVELDRDDGRWVYELKVLTSNGDRREIEIDAGSLAVLDVD